MQSAHFLVLLAMLTCLVLTGFAIWNWGPGVRKRSVLCPAKKRRARVLARQIEGDFCCLRVADVERCSLVPGEILTCDRDCLGRL